MGMPHLVVTAVLVGGRSKSEVAREYGVSRRWVITLVQRYLAEGQAGLEPRSRGPAGAVDGHGAGGEAAATRRRLWRRVGGPRFGAESTPGR